MTENLKISESELSSRQQVLDDVNSVLLRCHTDISELLDDLDWTPDHFIQPRRLHPCPFDSSHQMPVESLEKHTARCDLRQKGCSEEDVERILDNSSFYYENAKCVHTVKLDKEIMNSVLWNYHVKNHSVFYGYDRVPVTPDQEAQLLNREDRLGLAEYVVSKAREADILARFERDELMASANLADLLKKEAEEPRRLDHLEEMAAMRDYRRRRQSYRAKNVHITKKSHTEVMREVINNQMEMFAESLKEESRDQSQETSTKSEIGTPSRADDRDADPNRVVSTGRSQPRQEPTSHRNDSISSHRSDSVSRHRSDSVSRHRSDSVSRHGHSTDGGREGERGWQSERRRERERSKDRERRTERNRGRDKKYDRSRSRSATRDSSETDDSGHSHRHRHKKHKHKHKHKKSKRAERSDTEESKHKSQRRETLDMKDED